MLALALLANDRYKGIADPMEYNATTKRPGLNLAAAFTLVMFANSFQMVGETLWHMGIFTEFNMISAAGIGHAIRTVYLFGCLFM